MQLNMLGKKTKRCLKVNGGFENRYDNILNRRDQRKIYIVKRSVFHFRDHLARQFILGELGPTVKLVTFTEIHKQRGLLTI